MAQPFVRALHNGMGQAVAERTVLRKLEDGAFETWGQVASRVALGNSMLVNDDEDFAMDEFHVLEDLVARGALLMSGRHLQHGDVNQPGRNMEVFTNCATAPASFLLFQLLLNGSGVGRCYDDDMMLVDWDNAPTVWCVLDEDHPDYDRSQHLSARNARHMFNGSKDMMWFDVPDNREGWGKACELVELAAFEKVHKDKLLVLDFSGVREAGRPIKGMQGRPSSGPVPLMNAFTKAMMIRGAGLPKWKQAMYVDHFYAECILVGGARRAARLSSKWWKDKSVLDFIRVKRPVEYDGLDMEGVISLRSEYAERGEQPPLGFLWSSNNSVAVDREFWEQHDVPGTWANTVFVTATECAYADGTGEPGFINVDQLAQDDTGWNDLYRGDYVGSKRYQCEDGSHIYLSKLAKRAQKKRYHTITNPCGEIALNLLGGYCTLGALAPYHCSPGWAVHETTWYQDKVDQYHRDWDDAFVDAARAATRALIRVNTMDSIYGREVRRTNRIGVGLVGIHEWMWARFHLTFREALDEDGPASEMWDVLARVSAAVHDEALGYSAQLGLPTPHTMTTIPPGGTISKLFGLTEGGHLPAMAEYLRWVQFKNDDPLVSDYAAKGYPVRVLEQYDGHTIVGFPTQSVLAEIMPSDKLVTASQATMAEQYRWVGLLEHYWLEGAQWAKPNADDAILRDPHPYGNQVSYTLKFDPSTVSYKEFAETISHNQRDVRCCTVMPQVDAVAFEYQPEEPITRERYEEMVVHVQQVAEEVDAVTMGCANGACPVEFNQRKGVVQDAGYA
jgi:adenosylcobalamin-dependent ribonucleoside-triphosphate reductase